MIRLGHYEVDLKFPEQEPGIVDGTARVRGRRRPAALVKCVVCFECSTLDESSDVRLRLDHFFRQWLR